MHREIKFRAWDKQQKCMFTIFDNHGEDWFLPQWKDRYEVMQYTGLKDKNGKEIYEGDIIPYHFHREVVGIVRYGEYHNPFGDDNHGGHVGFYVEWNEENRDFLRVDLCYWVKVSEVIGNIYENPELLKDGAVNG